ncbi:lysylphosphatidylglycerol synthase transmembrane domain-containing protein [Bifidobacterium sp. ESL0775]|uniref:lysylphosphatidylglycerol synthase transmembrane domain-containing protein n=1 Tax=Bifidobacterium sp. ESL0775 TaxID=2983230 RepID=UPI0023F9C37B|nr:lysylphosphatidylglycerol synthase transmembrane domain-containing protein [Bifidobacterium sp. ESL0775]WEV69973.1 lysylphosphatidylglycerol synthase transmembrane domain-containing protein [Bifidobacterium sp. ESL0775]
MTNETFATSPTDEPTTATPELDGTKPEAGAGTNAPDTSDASGTPSTPRHHRPADIDDVAPQRTHNANDLLHAAGALILAVVVIVFATYMRGITTGVEYDAKTAGQAINWLMDLPVSVLQQFLSFVIVIGVLVDLLINREWLQSAVSVVALFCGYALILGLSFILAHLGVPALLAAVRSGEGSGPAMLPDFYAGIGAFLTVAGPKRSRSSVKWSWNTLLVAAAVFVIVSWHSVAGVIVSFAVGRVIGLVLRFAMGTRTQGLWGTGVVQAVRGIGLDITELHRRMDADNEPGVLKTRLDDDLIENSRIYDARDGQGHRYIISVLDSLPHAAGYLNQLWQGLRFTGVSMRRDRSASDAIHHHFDMLLGLKSCGLTTPSAYGVADSEESSVLVFNVTDTPSPCDPQYLDADTMAGYMDYLARANSRGYTHRRITPDTLARIDGQPAIVGWQNGDYASGSANIAMDKVQLLMLLCTLTSPELAIDTAMKAWGRETLVALAPFVQKVAVPSATRNLPGWNKQAIGEVRDRLNALAPHEEVDAAEPVTLARFNVKSFVSITLLIIAVAVIFTQLRPNEVIDAVRHANLGWALVCLLFSMLAWVGSAITLGSFMDDGKRHWFDLFCSQAASGFTAVSMPAGVGPAFVNLQFLRKNGYKNTAATAIMSVTWAVQGLTTIVLLLVMGLFTGRNMFSGMVPTNTLVVVIGAIVLALCLCMAIPPIRRLLVDKYLPLLRSYAHQLVEVLAQPTKLVGGLVGALILNIATGLGFWVALLAFGTSANPLETIFVFLLANTLGSAMPTPGGLGAVEAALTFAFTSIGVPPAVALSATLLYRVGFYWLRIPIGALAMKRLDKHNLL